MDEKYLPHYRTLGIAPGCTYKGLKTSYHRLAREWHPDRSVGRRAGKSKRLAEERIKEINHAYWVLSNYYRKHGRMPLEPFSPATQASGDADTAQPFHGTSVAENSPQKLFSSGRLIIAAALGLGLSIVIWHGRPGFEHEGAYPPGIVPETGMAVEKKYFSPGSGPEDVLAAQGAPTKTENGVWHYGQSWVYFENGVVTRWAEAPGFPLMVSGAEKTGKDALPQEAKYFSHGSTKQEVRAIQGTPLRETDTLWEYRVSRVYFKHDRVTGWYSSPLDPLRARD